MTTLEIEKLCVPLPPNLTKCPSLGHGMQVLLIMAKIYSPLAPVMRGRLGDAVMRKGQKATVAGKYQPSVANPKTHPQAINRCAWATVSQAASALRSIVDHSFEGIRGKRENLQRFMRVNRALLASSIIATDSAGESFAQLCIKGCPSIVAAPYVISQGSLPAMIGWSCDDYGAVKSGNYAALVNTLANQEDYERALALIGLQPGDQISLVAIVASGSLAIAFDSSEGTIENTFSYVNAARVTFKSQLPAGFTGSLIDATAETFNPNLIDRSEGDLKVMLGTPESPSMVLQLGNLGSGMALTACAVIRSQLDLNGDYLYSPQAMVLNAGTEKTPTSLVLESYEPVANVSEGSRFFLDNPSLVG